MMAPLLPSPVRRGAGRPRRSRRDRGFTLVELMIALVMGVIVALAAVALSRAATTTFYEQAKISNVEANVRTASERFRNDLSRIAYMSTPNIQLDAKVARVPGKTDYVHGLVNLRGIAIAKGASAAASHAFTTDNKIKLHDVYIAGNLTSDDIYRGTWISSGASDSCGGTAAKIRLSAAADPAVRRLFNGKTDATEILKMTELVFLPGLRMSPAVKNKKYAVQVMDARGCYHYTNVCGASTSGSGSEPGTVLLELETEPNKDTGDGLLTPQDTRGDVCGASIMEEVAIAPVHRVRWYVGPEKDAARNDPDPELDGPLAETRKFNLYRQLLTSDTTAAAADDAPFGASPVGPPEVIAEYAVDLRVGLLVDTTIDGTAGAVSIDLAGDDADFAKWAFMPIDDKPPATKNEGPQRIRSVRYRLAFRTPFPDRTADLPMGAPYLARYRMGDDKKYARVRTVMSEVALFNQAKAVY